MKLSVFFTLIILLLSLASIAESAETKNLVSCNLSYLFKTELIKSKTFTTNGSTEILESDKKSLCLSEVIFMPLIQKASYGCGVSGQYNIEAVIKKVSNEMATIELYSSSPGALFENESEMDLLTTVDVNLKTKEVVTVSGETSITLWSRPHSYRTTERQTMTGVVVECKFKKSND